MTEPRTKDKEREQQVVFSTKKVFEIKEIRSYDDVLEKRTTTTEVSINGDKYFISDSYYDEILKSLRRKIEVLKNINNDNAMQSLKEDIMIDIAKLIYKLESGDTV
ncbi:hypothetical protein AVT98_gp59 [Sulfolobales virus YNP1]|uniref:hypothetical protein n=1 Tax=Sulfolobales virus YNP1 TaxID=1732179 RepID=UPI000705DE65|nr:hypothetical protein AVT98_gp59 [Sulfolobales virus YNP1]ALG97151.1 hypothetical protein [Sulfolobales virus YNP1]